VTTIVIAVITGVGVLLAGSLPWIALLAPLNLRVLPALPWAIVPMAAYLWLYWRFIGGRIGSRETRDLRRRSLRANPVGDAWPLATLSGLAGFAALFALVAVMSRLQTLPESAPLTTPDGMPKMTAFLLLVMASLVAGVTEEAGFRGYMQGPIERRYGVVVAILINGAMFGLLHFPNHPGAVMSMLPYYIAVAAVYGGITWATDSILPALVLHAGGDVWSLTRLWATGRPEWQLSPSPPALVRDAGPDATFYAAVGALGVLGVVFVMLCRLLRRLSTDRVGELSPIAQG
jgi:membrane protease YdiL (CAAX protease family)